MDSVKLSEQQDTVFHAIELGFEHIFVTGRAGTGKSTLLNYLSANTSKRIAVCAPTGVAALNVGGQTIHSLFRFSIGLIANEQIHIADQTAKILRSLDTLIIDEVSMVNADLMDAIDRSLRQARKRPLEPFGGVQLVLFGDPYQLAPVPGDSDERAYFQDNYDSMWFFDAKVWKKAPLRIIELSEVYRQKDPEFANILNAVRFGTVTSDMANVLNTAGARRPLPSEGAITLATRNDVVSRINATALERLPGSSKTAEANVDGEFSGKSFPADMSLTLKVGAQVMFLRNDTPSDGGQRWVNGTLGVVSKIGKTVRVTVEGKEHTVEPVTWERIKYNYDPLEKTISRDTIAEFTQFPLRLAWAITIHKAQGATYDSAIIDLGSRAFSHGQSYVALSRIRKLDGMYFSRPLRPSDIIIDPNVRRFMANPSPSA